jgi:hypothetical protein
MTIEIQQPEVEAMIEARMRGGSFASVEDALLQALKTAQLPSGGSYGEEAGLTGSALVAAFQASPHKEINLEPRTTNLRKRCTSPEHPSRG